MASGPKIELPGSGKKDSGLQRLRGEATDNLRGDAPDKKISDAKPVESRSTESKAPETTAAEPKLGDSRPRRDAFHNAVVTPRHLPVARRRGRLLWLKVLLPLVALGTLGYLGYRSYFNKSENTVTIETTDGKSATPEGGMKVSGVAFEGRNKSDRAFSVTALSATEAPDNKDIVTLQEPQAQIELSDIAWIAVTAESGRFDRQRDWVDLTGKVTLYHDTGMVFVTDSAEIDLSNNDARSSAPVIGTDERRELTAEGFELRENGDVVVFKGRSHLKILPVKKGSDQ